MAADIIAAAPKAPAAALTPIIMRMRDLLLSKGRFQSLEGGTPA
jgi:hypothetical protein